MTLLVVGSVHLDILAQARVRDDVIDRRGDVQINVGGTAANIAINIAHEGVPVRLLTAMNGSAYSAIMADNLSKEGVEPLIDYHRHLPTAAFVAHMDTAGEMTAAVSSMPIEEVTFQDQRVVAAMSGVRAVMLDCNLSTETLNRLVTLANDRDIPVYVCAVSEEKSLRVGDITGRLKGVFLNAKEFRFFCDNVLGGLRPPAAVAKALRAAVIVTQGAAGSVVAKPGGDVCRIAPANLGEGGSRLGMGDALAAGTVLMHEMHGLEIVEAATQALRLVEVVGGQEHCHPGTSRAFEQALEHVQHRAAHDAMTGALNRHNTEMVLGRVLEGRRRGDSEAVAVLLLDIDHFKSVNDTYGHGVGDVVIKAVASAAQSCLRETDRLGRWGGEEFLIVLPDTGMAAAKVVAERIRATVEQTIHEPRQITISVGAAEFVHGWDAHALVEAADAALYEAKRGGRNRVVCAGPTAAAAA